MWGCRGGDVIVAEGRFLTAGARCVCVFSALEGFGASPAWGALVRSRVGAPLLPWLMGGVIRRQISEPSISCRL